MEGRDGIEGHVQSDELGPSVDERGELLDGIVTHVDPLEALQKVHRLRD